MSVGKIVRVYAANSDFRAEECALKFTLTFEGALQTGGAKAERKHARRRQFHTQLKRLWEVNSLLANWHLPVDEYRAAPARELLPEKYPKRGDYQFVPLISEEICVEAALHFHILRPTTFKGQNADPDNIVKILVDSLKMPQSTGELPSGAKPGAGEDPFFVLMQDDGLLSKITSVNDELLHPILGKDAFERSDTRVMIDVFIRPNFPTNTNLIFFSDDFEVWNHQWASNGFDNIRSWSNSELKARTTQCILRMQITASNFRMQRGASIPFSRRPDVDFDEYVKRSHAQSDEQHSIWNSGLRPMALALKEELQRRIYGEPPYPSDHKMHAIDLGMLAGVDPILDAASGLESLIRQLP